MFAREDGDVEEGAVAVDFDPGAVVYGGNLLQEVLLEGRGGEHVHDVPVQLDAGHAPQ